MSFDPADPIGSVFADVIGKPCWLAKRGHGSFITMEFGEPHLEVREPADASSSETLRRRGIAVHGDWHLWIYCCEWRILEEGRVIAHSESPDAEIDKAVRRLDGQKLIGVRVARETGASRIDFEGDLILATSRMDEADPSYENWMLATPDGYWLSYRADGRYSWHDGETMPEQAVWSEIPTRR